MDSTSEGQHRITDYSVDWFLKFRECYKTPDFYEDLNVCQITIYFITQ